MYDISVREILSLKREDLGSRHLDNEKDGAMVICGGEQREMPLEMVGFGEKAQE